MNPYLLLNLKQSYWPVMPTDYDSTKALMDKLSHKLQVICALEAAKMVLPIWEKYENKKLNTEKKEAPRKAIETMEKWLDGNATTEEVEKANVAAHASAKAASAKAATNAALAAFAASSFTTATNAATAAVYHATYAASTIQFYNEWRDRCYPFIQKEFQDRYDILIKNINGEL